MISIKNIFRADEIEYERECILNSELNKNILKDDNNKDIFIGTLNVNKHVLSEATVKIDNESLSISEILVY